MTFSKNSKRKGWGLGLALFVFASLLPAQIERLPYITPQQWTAIETNNNTYREWISIQAGRMWEVQQELTAEEQRPVLDPLAFGLRIAELTAIRRQAIARIADVVTANRKSLNPSQLAQLDALVVNEKLMAITYAAPCEYWFTPPPTADRPINGYDVVYSSHRYPGCTTPTLADYLELSPAIRADFAARRDQLFRVFDQLILDYNKYLAAYEVALEASPLEPAELGRPVVAILQVFRDYGDRRTEFINRRFADLSPAQQSKLRIVNEATPEAERAQTAACYGLLAKPALIIPNDQPNPSYYAASYLYGRYGSGCVEPPPFW